MATAKKSVATKTASKQVKAPSPKAANAAAGKKAAPVAASKRRATAAAGKKAAPTAAGKKAAPAAAKAAQRPAAAVAAKSTATKQPASRVKPAQAPKASSRPTATPKPAPKPAPKQATAKKSVRATPAPTVKAAPKQAPVQVASKTTAAAPVKKSPAAAAPAAPPAIAAKPAPPPALTVPPAKGVTKEGIAYTKDFDAKFLQAQRTLLLSERDALRGQATRLEDEANALIEEQEMGDVQFDDEGGEGDTMVVERERDLALSAQARQTIADIDAALERLMVGTYGYSTQSARPIPRERLEAIPWAVVLVEEKVGGIGRR